MKIVFFTGAGVSAESGIPTYRDSLNGVYNDKEIEKLVSVEGLNESPEKIYDHVSSVLKNYGACEPNKAHEFIAKLEDHGHKVTIITQNVDNLHERAGSKNVLHLHGQVGKYRSVLDSSPRPKLHDFQEGLSYDDAKTEHGLLRPHIVLFGEMPYNGLEAETALEEADMLVVVGTSFTITYTLGLVKCANKVGTKVIYIDPKPVGIKEHFTNVTDFTYIQSGAEEGVEKLNEICQLITEH